MLLYHPTSKFEFITSQTIINLNSFYYILMAVACSQYFSVTLDDCGQLWTFGVLVEDQIDCQEQIELPQKMEGVKEVCSMDIGECHIACVDYGGDVWVYGANGYYQHGNPDLQEDYYDSFHLVPSLENVKSVVCGSNATLCLLQDGTVYGFGHNSCYILGLDDLDDRGGIIQVPTQMSVVKDIVSIICGAQTVLLDTDGDVFICGKSFSGSLGLGDKNNRYVPVIIPYLSDIVQIACGRYHTLALNSNNELFAFGQNFDGQLGLSHFNTVDKPTLVKGHPTVQRISCGDNHSMIIDFDGYLWVTGNNKSYQLGIEGEDCINKFQKVEEVEDAQVVSSGGWSTIVKTAHGTWVFGDSQEGQLAPQALEDEYQDNIVLEVFPTFKCISPPSKWKDEYSHIIGISKERRSSRAKSARK